MRDKGWLLRMFDTLRLKVYGNKTLISKEEKEKLYRAQERAQRLQNLVYAQLGVELSVISGKDVPR